MFGELDPIGYRQRRLGERIECGGELEIIIDVGDEEPGAADADDSADMDGSIHSNGLFNVTQAIASVG